MKRVWAPAGRLALAGLLLASLPASALAQAGRGTAAGVSGGISASAGAAPDTVTVGDHFRVRVRISAPRGTVVEFPAFRLVEPVEEADARRVTHEAEDTWTATYTLAAWNTSDSLAGSFPVRVRSGDGSLRDLQVRVPLPVVRSVLPADSSLHVPKPARPPLPVATPATRPRGWITPAILLLALAAGILWLLLRRRAGPQAPPGDPRTAALLALDAIERERLPLRGMHHEYHVRTSRVLREYIEAGGGGGEELTSSELVAALRSSGTPQSLVDELVRLLREADRVKFSGGSPDAGAERAEAHGAALRRWIQEWPPEPSLETSPVPGAEEEAA